MPKRDYIHCLRCHVPLEMPVIKRCETETWYVDFAVCKECKAVLLAMNNPAIEFSIDGDCLKTLLNAKQGQVMEATVFPKEGIHETQE